MSTNTVEKVRGFLKGIGDRDPVLTTENVNAGKYVEHNTNASGGVESLKDFVNHLPHQDHSLNVVRVLQDGDFVLAHSEGLILDRGAFIDLFRFEDGLIVEHWNFSAKAAPPNKSGHRQGNFVFIAADGSVDDAPCIYLDMYRVENEKIVERWGFPEKVPQGKFRNANGLL